MGYGDGKYEDGKGEDGDGEEGEDGEGEYGVGEYGELRIGLGFGWRGNMGRVLGRIGERNMGMVEGYGDGGGSDGEMEYGIGGGLIWVGEDGGDVDVDVRYGDGERVGEDGVGGCEKVERRDGEVGKWDGLRKARVLVWYGLSGNGMRWVVEYVVIVGLMLWFGKIISYSSVGYS